METTKNDLMNGMNYYKDYINNKEIVLDILNSKEIEFLFINKDSKKYNYIIVINNHRFDYFEGLGNEPLNDKNKGEKIISAINCLLLDMSYSDYGLDEFIEEMGYKATEGIRVYNAIQENSKKIKEIFSKEEIDILSSSMEL